MRRAAALGVLGLSLAAISAAAPVRADGASDARARAQQLFDSALADVQAGRFADACPKFRASQEADPKTTTLVNLGTCYEKNGQTASAWGAFREAESSAHRSGRADLEVLAHGRAEALAPKLARITIRVGDAARGTPGLEVARDDAQLGSGEWNVAIPVDPGTHRIEARAPDRVAWSTRVDVETGTTTVDVPALAPAPARAPAPSEPVVRSPGDSWSTTKKTAAAAIGVGVAGLLTSGVLGLVASANYRDARGQCTAPVHDCSATAVAQSDRAYTLAGMATGVAIAGAAVAVAGGVIFVLAPSPTKGGAAMSVAARF
jgi:hypothetical protein